MREIVSPLSGIRSPFGPLIDPHKVQGKRPPLVLDFDAERYRTGGAGTTFSDAITHAATTNGTMVDSDGLIKWRPHNFIGYSENLTSIPSKTVGITIEGGFEGPEGVANAFKISGGANQYAQSESFSAFTGKIWAKAISGTGTAALIKSAFVQLVTLTEQWQLFEADSSARFMFFDRRASNTGGLSEYLIAMPHAYRSDLGGMVDNPDRGDSYVPTTSQKVFLPRRGHHVYDGSAWVNEGLLHESEARTNLITASNDFTAWSNDNTTDTAAQATGPDGETSLTKLAETTATGAHSLYFTSGTTATIGVDYTQSFFLKKGDGASAPDWVQVTFGSTAHGTSQYANFNLSTGAIGNVAGGTATIEDWGGGIYRCSFSAPATGASAVVAVVVFTNDSGVASRGASYAGNTAADVFVGGAQLEAGPTPSSYIPTSGSTVTRAAETLTIPAANLPWPSPNVIGAELVTNGDFDTDSDWTKGTGWTISGGEATKTAGVSSTLSSTPSIVLGKVYRVQFTVSGRTAGLVNVRLGSFTNKTSASTNGEKEFVIVSDSDSDYFALNADASFDGSIDNVSIREIDPLAVSIQMDGKISYADRNQADPAAAEPYLWGAIVSDYIRAALQTHLGTGNLQFRQSAGGATDTVESGGSVYSPGILVPYNIASRHGSTFINGAVDGAEIGVDTDPVALPDLETTDLNLGQTYMGCLRTFRMWSVDITDTGLEEATT